MLLLMFSIYVVYGQLLLVVVVAAAAFVVVMMTAAAALMMMTLTSTVAMMAATVAVTVVSATAALAAHAVDKALDFVIRSLARLDNVSLEVERLASKRVVKVNLHFVVAYRENTSEKPVAVLILQWYDGVFIYVVMVKMAVDAEYILVKVEHMLLFIIAIGVILLQGEVEFGALLQSGNLFLECVKGYSVAAYELERLFVGSFFYEFALTIVHGVQLVSHRDVFVQIVFHSSVFVCSVMQMYAIFSI